MTLLARTSRVSGVVGVLRDRGFRRWCFAQTASASGSAALLLGQSWSILQSTHSGSALAMLTVAVFGPVLVLGAPAGALLDRVGTRRLLLLSQTGFLLIGASLGLAAVTNVLTTPAVYMAATATGLVNAVDGPARLAHIVSLAGPSRTGTAVGLYEVVLNAARIVGPAAAGALIASGGLIPCFILGSAAFLPAIAGLLIGPPWGSGAPTAPAARERSALRAGLRHVRKRPDVRACILLAGVSGMLFNLGVTVPLLAVETFRLGGGGYGAMSAAFGVGAFGGALVAACRTGPPNGRQIRVLAVITAASVVATAYAPDVVTVLAGLAVAGFLSVWSIASAAALALLRSAPVFRGRVLGVWNAALPGLNPVTAVMAGTTADFLGPRPGFALSGIGFLLASALGWMALGSQPTNTGGSPSVDRSSRGTG